MYYCRFADLITDDDVAEINIPFTLDRRIISPGAFSSSFVIPNADVGAVVAKIVPMRTVCHVYRNEMILGSYIIWIRKYSSSDGIVKVDLQGASLESFFYRRRLQDDVSYTGAEQLDIAADLIYQGQLGLPGYPVSGSLGLATTIYEPSGILRDRTYFKADGKFIGDILEELANVDAGFEYVIHTWFDGAIRHREITFAYDKLNSDVEPFTVDEPGGVTSWEILYDGTRGGTVFWARGQTSASAEGEETVPTLSDPAIAFSYLDNGWPIIEVLADYQNASLLSTLNGYAAWWALNRSGPVTIPSFKVNPSSLFSHGFSPFSLGSTLNVVLANPAFPLTETGSPSMIFSSRMIGFELSVSEAGEDEMSIIVETDFDPTEVI